jgi:HTH-type transcriptional regulator/antitoxin HigA
MQSIQTEFDISAIQSTWTAFDTMVHLRPIRSEADYDQMLALMNSLLDVVGEDEDHALAGLLELVGDIVSKYERLNYAIDSAPPCDSLRFLIEARGLKQTDLSTILPQSNLSAILSGKRKISARLAGKLGEFFDVSPAIFIPQNLSN